MALKFTRLTRPAVRALKSGERINEHGIVAERQRNGDCRYSINIMVDRQRIHRVIGKESEGVTREQAERTIEAIRTKSREDRLDLPTGRKTHRTFSEAAQEYLSRIEHHPKHGRNLRRKRQHLEERLTPHFSSHQLNKLTEFAVSKYMRDRKEMGAAIATVNRELSTLSHFLQRCTEWNWIKSKPRIDKGQEARKQIVVLATAQKQALLDAAVADQDPLTWLFCTIAMGTAMRHSEILQMQWQEIDFSQNRVYLGKAKAGQREQPMPSGLTARLKLEWEQLGQPASYLFPAKTKNAKHPHRQTMANQFRRTVVRAGLDPKKVTPHILRHTAITELVTAGVDLPTIQRISGHKTLEMVLRYTQLSDDHIDRSVAKLDGAFPDLITPKLHIASTNLSPEIT